MRCKRLAALPLVIGLAALPSSGQSVSEELEKGIYAQQTTGDLDAAIQAFRKVLASNPVERVYAAQAQFHLAEALLQKGDLSQAAEEFNKLAANYSEYRDAVAKMARSMPGLPAVAHTRVFSTGQASIAVDQPDRWQDNATGVMVTAPPHVSLQASGPSTGGGNMALFSSELVPDGELTVWMRPNDGVPPDVESVLRKEAARKAQDRAYYADWAIRPESIQMRTVAGQPALSAKADYKKGEEKWVEYLIWVCAPKSFVQFSGTASADDVGAMQSAIDQLARTAEIP